MANAKYIYTFVKSGEKPNPDQRNGLKRSNCVDNAKVQAAAQKHTQDIYRRPYEDAQGHRVLESDDHGWEFVKTVGKKPEPKVTKEEATAQECIRAIEAAMPVETAVERSRVMHFRRDGMKEAVQAIKKHYGLR